MADVLDSRTTKQWRSVEIIDPCLGPHEEVRIEDCDGRCIASMKLNTPKNYDRLVAESRLIAAAPDLLAACELVVKLDGLDELLAKHNPGRATAVLKAVKAARAAIAKTMKGGAQ